MPLRFNSRRRKIRIVMFLVLALLFVKLGLNLLGVIHF